MIKTSLSPNLCQSQVMLQQATVQPERAGNGETSIYHKVGFTLYTVVLRMVYSSRACCLQLPNLDAFLTRGVRTMVLSAYPNNPAARKAIKSEAKWKKARWPP